MSFNATNLTLQNGGADSQGIAIDGTLSNPGNLVTLSSGGPVTQQAAIDAGSLLLHGTSAGSNFELNNEANLVSRFDADSPLGGKVQFRNSGALTVGAITGTGFQVRRSIRRPRSTRPTPCPSITFSSEPPVT